MFLHQRLYFRQLLHTLAPGLHFVMNRIQQFDLSLAGFLLLLRLQVPVVAVQIVLLAVPTRGFAFITFGLSGSTVLACMLRSMSSWSRERGLRIHSHLRPIIWCIVSDRTDSVSWTSWNLMRWRRMCWIGCRWVLWRSLRRRLRWSRWRT